ncbi:Protein of unknown function TPD sequence-motif [seawater metagenome]|uniref:CDAN1-interacting nuclease 1 n=1 Tax=seawater metagenome TaxID=1561972 RepID=A0A5E8CKB1_9ZZZZ
MKEYIINFIKLNKNEELDIENEINIRGDFGNTSKKELKKIKEKINNEKIGIKIINSIRNQYLKHKAYKTHPSLKKNLKKILEDYKSNDILSLSKIYDNSPMSIFRLIIKKMYKFKKFNSSSLKHLSERDYQQFLLAENNDLVAPLDQEESSKRSKNFEDKIEKVLKKKEIKYKTQEDLVKEQTEESGRPHATPDFLLEEQIMINGKRVNWIEVKNFYGLSKNFMMKKIIKQVENYKKIWGEGCLLFRYGVSDNLDIEDVCIVAI